MDISRSRFPLELVKIIQLVADSHFVAFDLEFSGIASRRKNRKKQSLQEVYQDVKAAAEQYQVLQVGLTIVHEDLVTGRYVARPYNFNINPIPASEKLHLERIWSFQSRAVDFLIRNGFDFELPYTHGIPYLSHEDEGNIRAAWATRDLEKAALNDMPIKEDDELLINYVHACVQKWQEEPSATRETFLNIPDTSEGAVSYREALQTLNRYQIRLVHQIVRNQYPTLRTVGKGHFIHVTAFDDTKHPNGKLVEARYRDREIERAAEFRWLIEAISGGDITNMPSEYFTTVFVGDVRSPDRSGKEALKIFIEDLQQKLDTRRRILVGHNCFTDLVYLYSCFIGQTPDSVEEFQEKIRKMFPAVVDTKFMASFDRGWHSTSLEDVESELPIEGVPLVEVPVEFDRYSDGKRLHEAGFDSLLTAKIAIKLSAKLEKEGKFPLYLTVDAPVTTDDDVSEHYSTAPESIADSDAGNLAATFKNALPKPVKAISNFWLSDIISTGQQFAHDDDRNINDQPEDLMEFSDHRRGKGEKGQLTEARDTDGEPVRTTFSGFPEIASAQSVTSIPSVVSLVDKPLTKAEILEKVARGDLMPRWEGGRGFWQHFGKKLQVNSAEEGICHL